MSTLTRLWKSRDVRNSIIFVFIMLVVFRITAHIPVPGVDTSALKQRFSGNQFFGLLNILSGGTLENFSVVALGVARYITSSIILQLLEMIVPSLEEMQKEESGRQKINKWTRWITGPIAFLQAYGLVVLFLNNRKQLFSTGGIITTIL